MIRCYRGLAALTQVPKQACVSLGVFDGFHRGHQAIVETLKHHALVQDSCTGIITFSVHPSIILQNRSAAPLMEFSQRVACFDAAGIDFVVDLPFDETIRDLSAEYFIDELLLNTMQISGLVLGYDSRFGKDRRGDAAMAQERFKDTAVTVVSVPALEIDGPLSSTRVRDAMRAGKLDHVSQWLGRPYRLQGRVERGDGRGREIGFPTLNISSEAALLLPPGVWVCEVSYEGGTYPAIANIGPRPTVDDHDNPGRLEAHVFDVDGDWYGRQVEVEFHQFIRDARQFESLKALSSQIAIDCEAARLYFAQRPDTSRASRG